MRLQISPKLEMGYECAWRVPFKKDRNVNIWSNFPMLVVKDVIGLLALFAQIFA